MTFISELRIPLPWRYVPIPDVQIWTSYVKAVKSYRLADKQTDR